MNYSNRNRRADTVDKRRNNIRVLLLCAGKGDRWKNHLGVPKQLIEFHGEPILHRTVRLLRFNGVKDILCVTRDPKLHAPSTVMFKPHACRWTVETIASTQTLWSERTVILLGDVYFTHRAIQKIISFKGDIAIFGRASPSVYTACGHRELFAISFNAVGTKSVKKAINTTLKAVKSGAWGNLWDIYHSIAGLPLDSGCVEPLLFRSIDDLTNDFDTPMNYKRSAHRYWLTTSPRIIDRLLIRLWLAAITPFHLLVKNGYFYRGWNHKSRLDSLGTSKRPLDDVWCEVRMR